MRRLIPDPGETDLETELGRYRPYENVRDDRPWVAVNMISTLDGRGALKGDTKGLGSRADSEHLLALRTRFDAILIGAGTMRAERYGRIISRPEFREAREREGLPPDALAVIVSGELDLPFDAPLFTTGGGEVLIVTRSAEDPPPTETPVKVLRDPDGIELVDLLKALRRDHGVRALLCEGGPSIFGQLAEADLADELFLTLTPLLTGGPAPHILEGVLGAPKEMVLTGLLEAEGDLFTRYRRAG
jgi:riboflavin biosynthesis pyrimidine reductase